MTRRDDGPDYPGPPRAALDDRATVFLERLRELGYLESSSEVEVLDRVCDRVVGVASFEVVRRIAAEVLFERQVELEHDAFALLEEEWKAIFH